ncbi:MAG: hypothetical protein NVS4B11_06050 [Ktedonobacteraceae bacterium]
MQDNVFMLPSKEPAEPGRTSKYNLPAQFTPLLGREQEVADVCNLLRRPEVRLLTLYGTGGVGKTRLGLQVATTLLNDFPDGVCYVVLAPIIDPDLVVPAIAQALELKETGARSLLDVLKSSLQNKHLLLFLDNFEQVVMAAPQLMDLLALCPDLKLLVTSRTTLHVYGEHEFLVPPLSLPPLKQLSDHEVLAQYAVVALFLQRAQAVKPAFQLTATNTRAIAEICMRLDGLPLAIELAAARTKVLSPQALLTRLTHRLQVLTGGPRNVPERQRTMHNTIMWSYDLLSAREQKLFQRLAVFVGGCTLEAIEALCTALDGESEEVLDGVTSLLDKSLLQSVEQEGNEIRLQMLETVREYGLEALIASGEREHTRRTHAIYYLRFSEKAESELHGAQQMLWLERLEREHENIRAAMQWSTEPEEAQEGRQRMEIALRLGGALEWFWGRHGYTHEGRTFLERALAKSAEGGTMMRARALNAAGMLAFQQGDLSQTEVRCLESLVLFRGLGDIQGIAFALMWLSEVLMWRGDLAGARSLSEEFLVHFTTLGKKENIAWAYNKVGVLCLFQGEYGRARALLEKSLIIERELENTWGIIFALQLLALVLHSVQGDPAIIRALLQESLVLARALEDQGNIFHYLSLSGEVALSQGDTAVARALAEELLANAREVKDNVAVTEALFILAKLEARQGNLATARALFEECFTFLKQNGEQYVIPSYMEGLAGVIAKQGETVWAAWLWGAAEMLRETVGAPIPPVERTFYEQSVKAARAQLGEKRFATAWAEGRTMTLEQALASQRPVALSSSALAGQPLTSPTKASSLSADGLTAREIEVLRLVARGLTDVRVAEQLIISPHTVNTHLKAIYGKIGVSSRSAATRYAIEHHLL